MGKGSTYPLGTIQSFYTLVVTVKGSVDELFMHYFHNLSSASGSLAPTPAPPWTLLGDFRPQTHSLPTLEKILRAPMLTAFYQFHNICTTK